MSSNMRTSPEPEKRPMPREESSQGANEAAPRKRARQSCDVCKNRKTKCITTGTGPCRYCASIGAICGTSFRQRRRPYYRVSEEEYETCMRLLRHFVPHTNLDLETMKSMLATLEQRAGTDNVSPAIETEESEVLNEEAGCMIIDAHGSHRYVGADSFIRFANAANTAHAARTMASLNKRDSTIMKPLVNSNLPPTTPQSVHISQTQEDTLQFYLPDRDICMHYVQRFFDEIQCLYWFYSPEQFYTLLDKTYSDDGATSSDSWMCSLYSIFAICSVKPADRFETQQDTKSSSDYLALAKSLGLQLCDEADTESMKALALLSLALHSSCFTVTAYLFSGMTVRIAFTLGLHRNVSPVTRDSVERERFRRLWWTVYLLDQEVSSQLGYPCAIVDEVVGIQTAFASEQILNPGANTPLGYQAACVGVIKLKKRISQTLYVIPAQSSRTVPLNTVTGCIASLHDWLAELPNHLRWSSNIALSHRRAVSVLHLRYWTALIHVQRPFLLYTVTRDEELAAAGGDKRRWYEELSHSCLDAAENSATILKRMHEHGLLSSLLLFDSHCIQELVQVFLLGKYYTGSGAMAESEGLDICMKALRGMDCTGWCEKILAEVVALVAARGPVVAPPRAVVDEQRMDNVDERPGADTRVTAPPRPIASGGTECGGNGALNEPFFENFQDFEFNMDTQLNVFDTLDLDMGTFTAAVGGGGYF